MKAFPTGALFNKDGLVVSGENGMDLKDYFAAKAMHAFLINCNANDMDGDENSIYNFNFEGIADMSYQMAEYMIEVKKSNDR